MTLTTAFLTLGWCLAGGAALWPVSVARRDVGVVDVWWSVGIGGAVILALAMHPLSPHAQAAGGVALLWALRHVAAMTGRFRRHREEDPRYAEIRAAWGPSFWWKSLFIVFLLQGVIQWLIALAAIGAIAAPAAPLGPLAWIGVALALVGLAVESIADLQLDAFKRVAKPGALCTHGLRARIRHPNYTGEIGVWSGLFLVAADAGAYWALVSPLLLTALLIGVSGAALLDKRFAETRPDTYPAWRARTGAFFPKPGAASPGDGGGSGDAGAGAG